MVNNNKNISNWGNYPVVKSNEYSFDYHKELTPIIEENKDIIVRGNGRCYGDASLADNIISTLKYSNLLEFDVKTGVFHCEAGVTLESILEVIVPKGWFLPVTPGTKYITVGGAVASDVHGKNHHADGSFSNHIIEMVILCADGEIRSCSPTENYDLFQATCGGMGLTGVVLTVKFQLKPIETAYIRQITKRARNLDEIFDLFEEYGHYTYTMSWIDCYKKGDKLGRSVLFAGEHAKMDEISPKWRKNPLHPAPKKKMTIPFYFPPFTMNSLTIRGFNFLYYLKNKPVNNQIVDYDTFFYPLDALLEWNKMYGKPGFIQYQFVLPLETSKEGLTKILNMINAENKGSFLAVLKLFGEQNDLISFPMKGYTLALDFPVTKTLFPFLDKLDEVVLSYGGRLYLSKDARMKHSTFWNSYPNAKKFQELVKKFNPEYKFSSVQSKRIALT